MLRQDYLERKKKNISDNNKLDYDTIPHDNHKTPVSLNDSKYEEIKDQLSLFFSFIKMPIIYKPVIFILLFMATPSYSDPMFYFYTNILHFSPVIMGRLKLVYGIASVLGILVFNKFFRNVSFKKIIWVTTILSMFFNMLSIVVVERLNTKIGVPDLYFCLTTDALTTALAEINTMPLLVLACNLCPKNIEGTLYAFLMSISNFGSLLANQIGSSLSSLLGITNSNFENLSMLIFIANIVLLIPMPALYLVDEETYTTCDSNKKTKEDINNKEDYNGILNKYTCKKDIEKNGLDSESEDENKALIKEYPDKRTNKDIENMYTTDSSSCIKSNINNEHLNLKLQNN